MRSNSRAASAPPHGREAVMAAIVAAAAELLVDQSPRDVTVREVAERAGVNHALVHRHFGTKEELLRAVLANRSDAFARDAGTLTGTEPEEMIALLESHADYWRILARFVLDAPDLLADSRPTAAPTILAMVGGTRPNQQARVSATVAGALALGWAVFGPHLDQVLGGPDPTRVRAALARTVRAVLAGEVDGPATARKRRSATGATARRRG